MLSIGLATRLTRFVVTEDLGGWLIRDPARRWADRNAEPLPEVDAEQVTENTGFDDWRHRLVSGLTCPFCTGTWLQLGAQAVNALVPDRGPLRTAWRIIAISQTAAYVLGHVGSRLGDAGYDEE